ncbi:MAG: fused MFS/spermidine synthase [Planctomycetota bacterium]
MSFALAWAVAFATGFVSLSCEVLWYRAYMLGSEGSPLAFGLMLGSYLLGIAVGAEVARRMCRAESGPGDARFLAPLGAFVLAANALSYLVVPVLARVVGRVDWEASLPLVMMAAGSLGAILPLSAHFGVRPDDSAGARVSWLFAGNIAGSTIGTLLTGYVLLEFWTLSAVAAFLAVVGCATAAVVFSRSSLRRRERFLSFGACALAGLLAVAARGASFDLVWERLLYRRAFTPDRRFALVKENRNDVICVTADRLIYGGGAYDGAISTSLHGDQNHVWRAYAMAAWHPAPREALVIGLSGGAWSEVLAHLPGLERLTIVEINPGYLDVIAQYPEVAGLLRNPRVSIVIDDGRRWLRRHPDRTFDLVVQNTSQHWRAHMTHLLSREHLELVKSRMRPGALFFYNTTDSPEAQASALAVFPHAGMLRNFILVSDRPLVADEARYRRVLREFRLDGFPVWNFSREGEELLFEEVVTKSLRLVPRTEI